MPCVFPVIGLKVMSFVKQAGEDPAQIKKHGLVFTLGVVLSFLVTCGRSSWPKGILVRRPWLGISVAGTSVCFRSSSFSINFAMSLSGVF